MLDKIVVDIETTDYIDFEARIEYPGWNCPFYITGILNRDGDDIEIETAWAEIADEVNVSVKDKDVVDWDQIHTATIDAIHDRWDKMRGVDPNLR